MYAMLAAARPERRDLSSLKLFASGADAMPPALVERFVKLGCSARGRRGAPLLTAAFAEVYGMVELSGPAIVKLTPARPVEGLRSARLLARLRGTGGDGPKGIPIPPYRARVVDAEGNEVEAGEVGELQLRGPGVMKGYDAGQGLDAEGWLHTGDLARRSRLGLIQFVTRKKDVVKHGGFSVFPAEVEAQLCEHPLVAEAIVFGVPHPTKGAVPVAVVVPKGRVSEDELQAWAKEHLASYKSPRAVVVVQASEVPRNANRKVLKDELRERVLPRLKAQLR
jgi:acyl-CoA synthetase (AMP-forming)/AMP-acid ligase II